VCGRYTLTNPDPVKLRQRFLVGESAMEFEPRFNVAPTDAVPAVRSDDDGARELGRLRWGLVPGRWAEKRSGRPLINARMESLSTQPAFAESFRERRCLIPADGFYEWRADELGKTPCWITRSDGDAGEMLHSCAIVTGPPNDLMRPIHDRMPVILHPGAEEAWLDPELAEADLLDLLVAPESGPLEVREVADLVNDVRNDDARLVEPRAAAQLF
jgi:putative SOS response-associated peptidase YedK